MLAHGGNPKLVGKNLMAIRDPEGTPDRARSFGSDRRRARANEYLRPNPTTGRVQRKATYVIRIDERTICASSFCKPEPP